MDVTQPEPVKEAGQLASAVSGAVAAVGAALVLAGIFTSEQVANWALVAGGIVTALSFVVSATIPYILAMRARMKVTPLDSPRTIDGEPLVPASGATTQLN